MKPTKLEPFLSIGGTVLGPNRRRYWLWRQKRIRPGFTLTGTPRIRTHEDRNGLSKDHTKYMRQIRAEFYAIGLNSFGKPRMKRGRINAARLKNGRFAAFQEVTATEPKSD